MNRTHRIDHRLRAFRQARLKPWLYWGLLLGLFAVRVALGVCMRFYMEAEASGLDDGLMLEAARAITEGRWLGDYGFMAFSKNMGFALWLALLHALHIPLMAANAALWALAALFGAWALKPLLPGQLPRVLVFAFLAYQPVSFAAFNQRIYRDAIFPAFCLLLFAGVVGLALRLRGGSARGPVLCGVVAGVGLLGAWLLREDAAVLLPFALCGLGLALLWYWLPGLAGRLARGLCCLLPFGVLGLGLAVYAFMNYQYYGVFAVNDMTDGAYLRAYGAVVAVSEGESGKQPLVPVTRAAIRRLVEEVPAFALLEEGHREGVEGSAFNGFANPETLEYGGSYYFALRKAAEYAGLTPDAPAAQQYWETLAAGIEQAVAEGRLKSTRPRASTVPAWQGALLGPTLKETGSGAATVLLLDQCSPRPRFSTGSDAVLDEVEAFVYSPRQHGYAEGSDAPYLNPLQKALFALCDVLVWVYRVALWPLLVLGLWQTGRGLAAGVALLAKKQGFSRGLLLSLLSLGLLLSFVLRLAVAAYMQVAAFNLPYTYLMYLAGGVPALLLFCAVGPLAGNVPAEDG